MKKKIAITLDHDTLNKVESLIDGKTIRNRSHAIETLLSDSLHSSIKRAVILAGGSKNKRCVSTRIVNGRSLLHYQIDYLKSFGIHNITVCAGRFCKDIEKDFKDGSELGVSIAYLSEDKVLGTAGAVKEAVRQIKNQKILVLHGDILTDFDIGRFIEFHKSEDSLASIAVIPRLAEQKFGKVLISGNSITKFISDEGDEGISIVNAGIYILEPEVFNYFPTKTPLYFEKDVFPVLAEKRSLSAYIFQGKWYELSRYKDYLRAKDEWLKKTQ